jgi:GMP synthase - Glutamine amidotransferase domain
MPRALAIRHVAFEDLGTLAPVLRTRNFEIQYIEAAGGLQDVDSYAPDLVIVLGGPVSVYEEAIYPFLTRELRFLERWLAAGKPVLGICLGCQLLARSLGARVYAGSQKEIGWSPLTLTEAGRSSPLRHLQGDGARVLHWHGDTFELPSNARLLASTEAYAHQAFDVGPHVLGLQFHVEATAEGLEYWYVGHASEIAATGGLAVPALRADADRYASAAERSCRAMFTDWLIRNDF